jgi:mono/diheme cytochrome c family protein
MARRARFALGLAGLAGAHSGTARGETTFYQARIAPIMDRHCVVCHGPEKQKAKLRVDTFEWLMKGAESGEVIKPGDVKGSELYRRITLPASEEEVMPSDGKPLLTRDEIKNIELWIAGGASPTKGMADFAGAPPLGRLKTAEAPLTGGRARRRSRSWSRRSACAWSPVRRCRPMASCSARPVRRAGVGMTP